jgi:hypothetical protein
MCETVGTMNEETDLIFGDSQIGKGLKPLA